MSVTAWGKQKKLTIINMIDLYANVWRNVGDELKSGIIEKI